MQTQPNAERSDPKSGSEIARTSASTHAGVVAELRRLGCASHPLEVVRALEALRSKLPFAGLALPSLTALAEAHLRERVEPGRDRQTGLLDARAFAAAQEACVLRSGGTAFAVRITLFATHDALHWVEKVAEICSERVGACDHLGRTDENALSVLPRDGGLRSARAVSLRLAAACREAFVATTDRPRIEFAVIDVSGQVGERYELEAVHLLRAV